MTENSAAKTKSLIALTKIETDLRLASEPSSNRYGTSGDPKPLALLARQAYNEVLTDQDPTGTLVAIRESEYNVRSVDRLLRFAALRLF